MAWPSCSLKRLCMLLLSVCWRLSRLDSARFIRLTQAYHLTYLTWQTSQQVDAINFGLLLRLGPNTSPSGSMILSEGSPRAKCVCMFVFWRILPLIRPLFYFIFSPFCQFCTCLKDSFRSFVHLFVVSLYAFFSFSFFFFSSPCQLVYLRPFVLCVYIIFLSIYLLFYRIFSSMCPLFCAISSSFCPIDGIFSSACSLFVVSFRLFAHCFEIPFRTFVRCVTAPNRPLSVLLEIFFFGSPFLRVPFCPVLQHTCVV